MLVYVQCTNPKCKQQFRTNDEMLGKHARCKACGTTFVMRALNKADEPAREISLSMLKDEPPTPKPSAPKPSAPKPSAAKPQATGTSPTPSGNAPATIG